jgi:hypothetical protein
MPKKSKNQIHTNVQRISRLHFLYVVALALQLVIFDVWHVTTLEASMRRWIAIASLLVVTAIVWLSTKLGRTQNPTPYKWMLGLLLLADIVLASLFIFWERGMASVYVLLYAVPIIASAALLSRSVILVTSLVCAAAYFATTYSYFVVHFNEGYKSQLYGTLLLWTIIFIVLGQMLWSIVRSKKSIGK